MHVKQKDASSVQKFEAKLIEHAKKIGESLSITIQRQGLGL